MNHKQHHDEENHLNDSFPLPGGGGDEMNRVNGHHQENHIEPHHQPMMNDEEKLQNQG